MAGKRISSSIFARIGILLPVVLWFACTSVTNGFVPQHPSRSCDSRNLVMHAWFAGEKKSSTPKVQKPDDFVLPEPKPLQIDESTDMGRFTRNTLAFAIRLGVGAFVLGWKIDTIFYKDDENVESKKYSLSLGPFSIRDTSSVLNTEDPSAVPRPEKPLVLYEYDASPYCKRVREFINLLDLTVEYRPCPGARQGKFSDELYEKTGRRTVSYLFEMICTVAVLSAWLCLNWLCHGFSAYLFSNVFAFVWKYALWPGSLFVRP